MKPWTPDIDPSTIPDDVLKSERGRRNASKKTGKYTGGLYWKRHNPNTSRCRCKRCMKRRESPEKPS